MRRSLLWLSALALATSASAGQLALSFEPHRVTATGITPGGTVIWFGAAVEQPEWFKHVYHWQHPASDDDADGVVVFERAQGFPETSVLVVVDVASGKFASGAPERSGHRGASSLHRRDATFGPRGTLDGVRHHGRRADVLVVREKQGAWRASSADGSELDHDGAANGELLIDLADLAPFEPLAEAHGGVGGADVLVIIDPDTLEYFVRRVGNAPDWTDTGVAP